MRLALSDYDKELRRRVDQNQEHHCVDVVGLEDVLLSRRREQRARDDAKDEEGDDVHQQAECHERLM